MNKKRFYILASTVLLIGLAAGLVQYVGMFDALYAAATNPGHSWSQMECTDTLCVDTTNQKLIVNNMQMSGLLYDSTGSSGVVGATLTRTLQGLVWDGNFTWPGSTKKISDCVLIGGTLFDTGAGTICRAPLSEIPVGWTQAGNWQRYSVATWGGDSCARFMSTGPATFANQPGVEKYYVDSGGYSCMNDDEYTPCSVSLAWGYWNISFYRYCPVSTTVGNPKTNRVEIGLY